MKALSCHFMDCFGASLLAMTRGEGMDCFGASLLAMTKGGVYGLLRRDAPRNDDEKGFSQ